MEARLANYFGERLTESHLKMAQVIQASGLHAVLSLHKYTDY